MKGALKAVWWGALLALIVVLIGVWITLRHQFGWGLLFTIIVCVFIGVLICVPVARAISEGLMSKLFALNKGKVRRDYSRARWLVSQGQFEQAIAEFRRALEQEPENIALRREIADIYASEIKDYRRAISELEECLSFQPEPAQGASILNRIADIYETNLGETQTAVATLSRIIHNQPGTKEAQRAQQRIESIRRTMQTPG